ncbi:hypothetical protein GCM10027176_16780 [Actinoallomurus bryophytorum]|uniref:Uncharacterized protein n=1 Tax=Actinoallomurus bryophytorum TaxID=1490222 RepID=A0A543CLQ4_9ACTN|nr:hypothetical protein [Actinoallomurus bryophytorum]TQL98029.1 hypothetical protein FB559_3643 [Actinoallomurus bryophytorum]
MPGDYQMGMSTYPCAEYADGHIGYCAFVGYVKVPMVASEMEKMPQFLGWRSANESRIEIPLERIIAALEDVGITVNYDPPEVARLIESRKTADHVGPGEPGPEIP